MLPRAQSKCSQCQSTEHNLTRCPNRSENPNKRKRTSNRDSGVSSVIATNNTNNAPENGGNDSELEDTSANDDAVVENSDIGNEEDSDDDNDGVFGDFVEPLYCPISDVPKPPAKNLRSRVVVEAEDTGLPIFAPNEDQIAGHRVDVEQMKSVFHCFGRKLL